MIKYLTILFICIFAVTQKPAAQTANNNNPRGKFIKQVTIGGFKYKIFEQCYGNSEIDCYHIFYLKGSNEVALKALYSTRDLIMTSDYFSFAYEIKKNSIMNVRTGINYSKANYKPDKKGKFILVEEK